MPGKPEGYAIEIESVLPCAVPLDPKDYFQNFTPPQSFVYLDRQLFKRIEAVVEKQPPKGRVIFVGGVHGVGKTTLCRSIPSSMEVIHKSASQLIRESKESAIARNTKAVADIPGNQELLIYAVRRISQSGQTLLLDGHFALLNSTGKVQPLPTEVFAELGIDGIVLVHDKPSNIVAKLRQRDGGEGLGRDEITSLQATETSRAGSVADELGLPLFRVNAQDESGFAKSVQALL